MPSTFHTPDREEGAVEVTTARWAEQTAIAFLIAHTQAVKAHHASPSHVNKAQALAERQALSNLYSTVTGRTLSFLEAQRLLGEDVYAALVLQSAPQRTQVGG